MQEKMLSKMSLTIHAKIKENDTHDETQEKTME
jgi:hypothetical protein